MIFNMFIGHYFQKLIATKLSDISFREDGIVATYGNSIFIQFLGWEKVVAQFRILPSRSLISTFGTQPGA